jgi:Fungal protein kinase
MYFARLSKPNIAANHMQTNANVGRLVDIFSIVQMSLDSSESGHSSLDNNRPVTPPNPDPDILATPPAVKVTPFVKRIASVRLPDDVSEVKVTKMAKLWKLDLAHADTFVDGEFTLITTVFKPPFSVEPSLLSKMKSYNRATGWKGLPAEWTEESAASFLNSVVRDLGSATGEAPKRSWISKYCNQILPGSPIKRKPDIVLLDVNHEEPVHWRNVRAITEVTRSKTEVERMVDTINDKTFIMFTTQFNRTFIPMISIFDKRLRLTVTDRQGQLRSNVYDLSGPHPTHAHHLILLLATLCFGSPGDIGYDPSVITNARDETTDIICDNVTYKVIDCIYAVQGLVGRATHVFLVMWNNRLFILKDSWIEQSRRSDERRHLKRIQGVSGVPVLHGGSDVKISDKLLTTWLIRQGFYGIVGKSRVRRRLVSSSIGVPISQFKTKRELISAFRDIAESAYCALHNLHQGITAKFDA